MTRVYTRTLRPSTRKYSSKMEVSTPKYKTLRILCPVTEGGTLKVFCHLSSSTVTETRISCPLYSVRPGIHFAIRMLFTTIAYTIAMFDIKKTADEHGNEVTPALKFNPGVYIPVVPPCRVRLEGYRQLIGAVGRLSRSKPTLSSDQSKRRR